jgi:hypothetical protein
MADGTYICHLLMDPIKRLPNISQGFGGDLLSMAVDLPFSILDLSEPSFFLTKIMSIQCYGSNTIERLIVIQFSDGSSVQIEA